MLAKISSILPSSPRITNVDLSVAQPMRRGMPTFGVPVAPESNPRAEFKHLPTEVALDTGTYNKAGQISMEPTIDESIEASLDIKI